MAEVLAWEYQAHGYRFVPIVREALSLHTTLRVLFLRRDAPGSVIQAGDLDNRLKTLIDALRLPQSAAELGQYQSPEEGEDPFFCLLEDDKQVTHFEVESDTLLDPLPDTDSDARKVRLVITVEITTYELNKLNRDFP